MRRTTKTLEDEKLREALDLVLLAVMLMMSQVQKINREDLSDEWQELYDSLPRLL